MWYEEITSLSPYVYTGGVELAPLNGLTYLPCLEKRCPYGLASNFARCWSILKILSSADLGVNLGVKQQLNIPPCLICVAALPCEMWTSENQQQPETCIAMNDRSQVSVATCLRCDGTFDHNFIKQFTAEYLLKVFLKLLSICRS